MISSIIKLKFCNHFQAHPNQDRLLRQIIKHIIKIMRGISKKTLKLFIDQRLHKNGNIIIQIKKVITEHLLSFLNTFNKEKSQRTRKSRKMSGSKFLFKLRPNFNGTSKNFNETSIRPCPAPSQMLLN